MFTHLFIISCCSSKKLVFCPLLYLFHWTANSDKVPESVLSNDDVWELSRGCCQIRGCAEGGGDGWRMKGRFKKQRKKILHFKNIKSWWRIVLKMSGKNRVKKSLSHWVKLTLSPTVNLHILMCLSVIEWVTTSAITRIRDQRS